MDKTYLKNLIVFIFILLLSTGCAQKDPTFTLLDVAEQDQWDADAYNRWIKGR